MTFFQFMTAGWVMITLDRIVSAIGYPSENPWTAAIVAVACYAAMRARGQHLLSQ